MKKIKIGVIGLGLIGGSVYKSLKIIGKYDLIGISRTVKGDNIYNDYKFLSDCDVVFVCVPMNKTLDILDKLENYLSENSIVTDVCSLKRFVSKKKYLYKFIPSHPMAGTENSGWDASFPDLFKGAKWMITPLNGVVLPEQEVLENIIEDMGAKVVITSPEEHDRAAALISHMPMIVAQALCQNIKDNSIAQIMASSGFKDTSRLALSNTEMAEDMVLMNRDNIDDAVNSLKNNINVLLNGNYKEDADKIRNFRKNLYD